MTETPQHHWDPFEGPQPAGRDKVEAPVGPALPGWLGKAGGLLMLAGFAAMAVEALFLPGFLIEGFPVAGAAIVVLGLGLMFLPGGGRGRHTRRHARLRALAERLGWGFTAIRRPVPWTNDAPGLASGDAGNRIDPRVVAAYRRLGRFLAPGTAEPLPLSIEGVLRGTARDGTPVWMGVQEMETLDATDGESSTLVAVAGAPLGRDTRLRVMVDDGGPRPPETANGPVPDLKPLAKELRALPADWAARALVDGDALFLRARLTLGGARDADTACRALADAVADLTRRVD
ncbi:hypothetical protein [Roseovarius salinarum]|uniref:hypothetical protein n=1 Tax=Roseovarius salinarum TaxID=1981892 RepID=UPI000C31CE84|nr:hypothetical protein [Roseovarius salinarum]